MASVSYNGVSIPYPYITRFSQDAVGDEGSDTDWCYMKLDLQVQTVVSSEYLLALDPTLTDRTNNPAEVMAAIRSKLLRRRRDLSVTVNGVELVPKTQQGLRGRVDARNGPVPQSCVITELTNTTFALSWHVIAHYWENISVPDGNNPIIKNLPGSPVLYNRWSETVDLDACQYTRRTRTGKFIIRSDNDRGVVADEIRNQMAAVAVPAGFVRDSASYTVSPDGLGIAYTIVDRECYKPPPFPAFKASGYYQETTSINGAKRYGHVFVRLEGAKTVSQLDLIKTAMSVATAKLKTRGAQLNFLNGPKQGGFRILQNASMKVNLYENEVEMDMTAMAAVDTKFLQGVPAFASLDTAAPGSDPGQATAITPGYTTRGTANLLLEAAAYYDPSLQNNVLLKTRAPAPLNPLFPQDGNSQLNNGLPVGQAGKAREA